MAWSKETAETPDARRFADLLFQIVDQVRLRRFEGGPEIEEQGREQTEEERRGQDGSAGPKIDHEGKVQRAQRAGERVEQEIVAPNADGESDGAADHGEEQAFAQQLAHDPPARSAKGDAERDFLRARGAAGEQHVGQIQARDEQDRAGHAHEQRRDQGDGAVVLRPRAEAESRRLLDLQFARELGIRRLHGVEALAQHRQTATWPCRALAPGADAR